MKYKKLKLFLVVAASVILVMFLMKKTIATGLGNWLIVSDEPQKTEVLFVLSGGAFDRGNKAYELYEEGWAETVICTGVNQPPDFKAIDIAMTEGELTMTHMINIGMDESKIKTLEAGTSTWEEIEAIREYCQQENTKEIAIVSSAFHTRRIRMVTNKCFKNTDIECHIYGAPSSTYSESNWWNSEYGLIAMNNEYIKYAFYLMKY